MMRALSYVGFTSPTAASRGATPRTNWKISAGHQWRRRLLPAQHLLATTPDILTAYVRDNGVAGHCVRACWQPWARRLGYLQRFTYELIENKQRPGFEEQIDNEKYEVRFAVGKARARRGRDAHRTQQDSSRPPAALSYHNLTVPTSGRIFWLSHATRRPN